MLFSLVPWLLSLLVFFPAVGAGIFGSNLDAGPLPVVGNLLLHLAYGAILGTVYCIPEFSEAPGNADHRMAEVENDALALSLVVGLVTGLIVGAIVAPIIGADLHDALNLTLVSGGVGTVIGAVVGPFIGLTRAGA